jgi:hypothetical protein
MLKVNIANVNSAVILVMAMAASQRHNDSLSLSWRKNAMITASQLASRATLLILSKAIGTSQSELSAAAINAQTAVAAVATIRNRLGQLRRPRRASKSEATPYKKEAKSPPSMESKTKSPKAKTCEAGLAPKVSSETLLIAIVKSFYTASLTSDILFFTVHPLLQTP